jgi:cell migration-inducing and hyaluronan-binding protein
LNAAIGDNSIVLNKSISGLWRVGDQIVVAGTSFDFRDSEAFRIVEINGNTIKLNGTLKYNHWGRSENHLTHDGRTVTLDERAEVANLTRNIKIQPDESSGLINEGTGPESQIGGHVMVMPGGKAYIDSVEFSKMGQAGIMARYPFHWHRVGNATGQFIKNSSIHDSFQRCITIHRTDNTLVSNNVCYKFKGHGFFLEDGNEVNNTISYNLGIMAMLPSSNKILLASDNPDAIESGVAAGRFMATSTFWISHPSNSVFKNIASGSQGTGFWMAFASNIRNFNSATKHYEGNVLPRGNPKTENTLRFSDNVAHSTGVGITWDGAPDLSTHNAGETHIHDMNNSLNPQDRKLINAHYQPSILPEFSNLVAYKNYRAGIYFRGNSALFKNAIVADNGWSLFFAYNQIVKDSVVISESSNNASKVNDFAPNLNRLVPSGIVIYDGPFELDNVDFINFSPTKVLKLISDVEYDLTPIPFFNIGGARRYTNLVKRIHFNPEPYYRVFSFKVTDMPWVDSSYTKVRDLDGSLTGMVNGLLVPDFPFSITEDCINKSFAAKESFKGFKLCSPSFQNVGLFFLSNDRHHIPFLVQRSDNKTTSLDSASLSKINDIAVNTGPLYQNKVNLIINPDNSIQYNILFPNEHLNAAGLQNLLVFLSSEILNTQSPIIKLIGLGSSCTLQGATAVNEATPTASIAKLKSLNTDAYYSSENDFYIKLKSSINNPLIIQNDEVMSNESLSAGYTISCSNPVVHKVQGLIDQVVISKNAATIYGWACDFGVPESINIHLYTGGPAGTLGATLIKGVLANRPSDLDVQFACGNLGIAHRFIIPLNTQEWGRFLNKKIYIHGISKSGSSNNLLLRSGDFGNFPGN